MHLTRLFVLTLPLVRAGVAPKSCQCGHIAFAHEHYRRGTDCSLCECVRYKGQRHQVPSYGGHRERRGAA